MQNPFTRLVIHSAYVYYSIALEHSHRTEKEFSSSHGACFIPANDTYSCSVCFPREVDLLHHGTLSAIVSLLFISMFVVLWYKWVPDISRIPCNNKKVPCLPLLNHPRTTPPHHQVAPGGHDLPLLRTRLWARQDSTEKSYRVGIEMPDKVNCV